MDGQYTSEHEPEAGVIHVTPGYSRDHRPDLNKVVVQLIADNQAGIPLWMEPLSGNSSDKRSFRATVKAHVGQLKRDYQLDYLLADSALYTAETLPTLNELGWITRVPESLKEARQAIEEAAPVLMESLDKLSYQHLESAYAGVRTTLGRGVLPGGVPTRHKTRGPALPQAKHGRAQGLRGAVPQGVCR